MTIISGVFNLSPYRLDYAGVTDTGMVRKHNEDNFLVLEDSPVFCVADGAGGHANGAQASSLTLHSIKVLMDPVRMEAEDETIPLFMSVDKAPSTMLESAVLYANTMVYLDGAGQKMASTIVCCHFEDDLLHIAHVGDSRMYLYKDKDLQQLSEDHSLVNMLYRQGEITKEEMRTHPRKNVIVRAIGMEKDVKVSVASRIYKSGDCYLLCSDGLTGMVTDDEISEVLQRNADLTITCQIILDMANQNGGRDNITFILIRVS